MFPLTINHLHQFFPLSMVFYRWVAFLVQYFQFFLQINLEGKTIRLTKTKHIKIII